MINTEIIKKLQASGVIVDEKLFVEKFMTDIESMGLSEYPIPSEEVDKESENLARFVALGLEVGAITLGLVIVSGAHSAALGGLGVFLASWGGAALGGTSRELIQSCRVFLTNQSDNS